MSGMTYFTFGSSSSSSSLSRTAHHERPSCSRAQLTALVPAQVTSESFVTCFFDFSHSFIVIIFLSVLRERKRPLLPGQRERDQGGHPLSAMGRAGASLAQTAPSPHFPRDAGRRELLPKRRRDGRGTVVLHDGPPCAMAALLADPRLFGRRRPRCPSGFAPHGVDIHAGIRPAPVRIGIPLAPHPLSFPPHLPQGFQAQTPRLSAPLSSGLTFSHTFHNNCFQLIIFFVLKTETIDGAD